ncbi:CST complex subunit ctc1 [Thoreauomyces humboldtii]|nr:CST complex subunit ctc1 [Thoreauomyces humboldtii]
MQPKGSVQSYRVYRIAELLSLPSHVSRGASSASLGLALGHKPILVGRFLTKRQARQEYPRAGLDDVRNAICFCDTTGALPCEFTSFDMRLMDRTCCLLDWNAIPVFWSKDADQQLLPDLTVLASSVTPRAAKAFSYLEVSGDPLLLSDSHFLLSCWSYDFTSAECDLEHDPPSLLPEQASEEEVEVEVDGFSSTVGSPPRHLSIAEASKSKFVSITGTVRAKSLITFPGHGIITFFLELQWLVDHSFAPPLTEDQLASRTILTTFVMYREQQDSPRDILPYYEGLHVGKRYLFTHLKPGRVSARLPDRTEKQKVLQFMWAKSSIIEKPAHRKPPMAAASAAFDLSQGDVHFSATADASCAASPFADIESTAKAARDTHFISYSGRITRVVDVLAGVYELDGRTFLYLTHFTPPGFGRGLRIGTDIDMHNVHLVLDDLRFPQHAENLEPVSSRMTLIACAGSTLHFRAFASVPGPCFICRNDDRSRVIQLLSAVNIPDLLVVNKLGAYVQELENSATRGSRVESLLTQRWPLHRVLKLLSSFGYVPIPHNNSPMFIRHELTCITATWRYPIPIVVCVADIQARICKLQDAAPAVVNAQSAWSHTVITSKDLDLSDSVLIGWLTTDSSEITFHDSSGSLRCSCDLDLELPASDFMGRLVLIKSVDILCESITVQDSLPGSVALSTVALRWTASDLTAVGEPLSSSIEAADDPEEPVLVPAISSIFLLQHVCGRAAKLAGANLHYTYRIVEGISWELNGSRLQWESRPTYMEIPCTKLDMPSWDLDTCYILTNPEVVPSPPEQALPSPWHERTLFLKWTGATKAIPVPDLSVITRTDARHQPNPKFGNVRVPRADLDRVRSKLGLPSFRSVGALVSRHMDPGCANEPFQDYLVSLEGVVEHREFRSAEPDLLLDDPSARRLFDSHGIGTGRHDRILFIRLRDRMDPDSIDLYLDLRRHAYPLAMIPGALVRFRRIAVRKSGRGLIYAQFVPETTITVHHDPVGTLAARASIAEQAPQMLKMADFHPPLGSLGTHRHAHSARVPVAVKCNVTFVQEVSLWTVCLLCQCRPVRGGVCPNGCAAVHHAVQGRASCFAEDGTTEAILYIDDADPVFALLRAGGCSTSVLQELTAAVRSAGECNVEQTPPWFTEDTTSNAGGNDPRRYDYPVATSEPVPAPTILESCVRNLSFRHAVMIRCRRVTKQQPAGVPSEETFRRRTFRAGGGKQWPTMAHSRLSLKVLQLEPVQVQAETARLLAKLAVT